MSSILKALRRLEEERARKSHMAPEIATSLLRNHPRHRPVSHWLWSTIFACVVALILAVILWQWRPETVISPVNPPPAPSPIVLSESSPAGKGGELIIEEVIDRRRPILLPPTTPAAASPTFLPAKPIPPVSRVEQSAALATERSKPAVTTIERRWNPVVSAIAWQEDSSARMAVVDGLPVMTGEVVGTAKVQEILSDRIVFAQGGGLFTVYVDSQ